MKLKLRWFLPALGLLSMTLGARAQAGLYFNPIVTHVTNSQADNGVFAFLGEGSTARYFGGISMGGYYDLARSPRYNLGIDVRDELEHGNSASLNSFLVGARVSAKLHNGSFKPYVQLSGGSGTTRSPLSGVRTTKAMYKIYAGADYALNRHLDFRIAEVGYGSLTTVSTAQYNATVSIPAAKLVSVSSGLVFRF